MDLYTVIQTQYLLQYTSTYPHESNMRGTQAFSAFSGPFVMSTNKPTDMDAIHILDASTPTHNNSKVDINKHIHLRQRVISNTTLCS